jgi:hypothetical protein
MNRRTTIKLVGAIATALFLTTAVSSAWAVTISGTVRMEDGTPVSGVTMEGLPGNPITDNNGAYSATVDAGFTGTVTPTEINFVFAPGSRSYTSLLTNQPNQDYVAQQAFFSIFGDVRTAGGVGIAGVSMGGFPATTTTDATGHYQTLVLRDWSGTVTPAKSGYTFQPQSTNIASVTANVGPKDFTGTPTPATGACCVGGSCQILTEAACATQSGTYQGNSVACGSSTCAPTTATGACCVGEVCTVTTGAACTAQSGTYRGDATACGPNPCTQTQPVTGACCVGATCTVLTEAACTTQSGIYQGNNAACISGTCTSTTPTGACCVGENCAVMTQAVCAAQSGTYQGDGTGCGPNPCTQAQPATGACCVGTTCSVLTEAACTAQSGIYQGDDTTCGASTCSSTTPTGACCVGTDCEVMTQTACAAQGGTYQGDGTGCGPNPCTQPQSATGACCTGEDCAVLTETACTAAGGTYQGDDTTCVANPCSTCVGCACGPCGAGTLAALPLTLLGIVGLKVRLARGLRGSGGVRQR